MTSLSRLPLGCAVAGLLCGALDASAASPPTSPGATAPAGSKCDPVGSYRLRHRSNGAEGWWFLFQVKGSPTGVYSAELLQKAYMLDIPAGPIQLAADLRACTLVLTAKTEHAGDIRITLTLDPKTNAVSGQLTRSKTTLGDDSPVSIAGAREVGPVKPPACLSPGVYDLEADPAGKWKLTEGHPFPGDTCMGHANYAHTTVRIEPLGNEIIVDGVSRSGWDDKRQVNKYSQNFSRSTSVRLGECEISVRFVDQDFRFQGKLKFLGDKITGVASKAEFQVFNDGEAGENLWKCGAKNVALTGTRITD